MLDVGGLASRSKLAVILTYLADDPDGVWSEACDGYGGNVHLDVDEVAEICRLYRAAEAEAKAALPVAAE